jgi:hypothetical protein
VVIQAALSGNMFQTPTINSDATLNSLNNTLTWNTSNTPALESVAAGSNGSVQFTIGLKNSWPILSPNDKNFTVQVKANIRSLSVPAGITADQTVSNAELITKLGGQAALATTMYFEEPSDAVTNQGPYPPQVNQATQYTVHWQIRNYSTDLKDVHVAATLQSGARMVKVIKSTAASSPVYDSQTGRVTWDISSIAATQGALGAPVEAIFQIEATPAVNQAGSDIVLMSDTALTATDAFTGRLIEISNLAKSSNLPDDTEAAAGDRRVQP